MIEGPHSKRVKREAQARIIQMIKRNLSQMDEDERKMLTCSKDLS